MSDPVPEVPTHRMTSDEFIAWALDRDGRWELEDGRIVAMAPERVAHELVKGGVHAALRAAVARAGLPCQAFPDGMSVPVDDGHVYEPDALVRCGDRLVGDATRVMDPVIVVEGHSPSTGTRDASTKFVDYFRIPSLRHYLQVHPAKRVVVHHSRPEGATTVESSILREGTLRLDPPGLELDIGTLFADL